MRALGRGRLSGPGQATLCVVPQCHPLKMLSGCFLRENTFIIILENKTTMALGRRLNTVAVRCVLFNRGCLRLYLTA